MSIQAMYEASLKQRKSNTVRGEGTVYKKKTGVGWVGSGGGGGGGGF